MINLETPVDETCRIPFNDYLFKVINQVDKKLLYNDISYDDTINNQNYLRDYFDKQFPNFKKLSKNEYVSLFAFTTIYDNYHDKVKSWEDVGKIFYEKINDGYKLSLATDTDVMLAPSKRICMCSQHTPSNYFKYDIDCKYRLITGTICVNKNKIVDVRVVQRLKNQERQHREMKNDIKKINDLNKTLNRLNCNNKDKVIGLFMLLRNVNNNRAKNKLYRSYIKNN